jgi:GTP-binding protein EngB required for normal cell division
MLTCFEKGNIPSRVFVHDSWLREKIDQLQNQYHELKTKYDELLGQFKAKNIGSFEELQKFHGEEANKLVRLVRQTKPLNIGGRNFGFFGITSTGKSTMINTLIGSNVAKTGPGETTTKIIMYDAPGCRFFDLPGRNDDLSYFSMEYIAAFKALTGRFVLVTATVKEMTKVFHVFDAADLRYDIVVNKFDNIAPNDREPLKRQIRDEIQQCQLKGVDNVWFVSAKNPEQFPDWMKMRDNLKYKN